MAAAPGADFIFKGLVAERAPRSGMGSRSAEAVAAALVWSLRRVRARKIRQKKPASAVQSFVRFELESEPPWRLRRAPRLHIA